MAKKKTLIASAVALVVIIPIMVFVLRYEDKTDAGIKFRYDRFTKIVYVADAYKKKPVWIKTNCINNDQCIESERERKRQQILDAIEDAAEDRTRETQRRLDDIDSRQRYMQFQELIK